MSIKFHTVDPKTLLASIRTKIDAKNIETWAYDDDGHFTHTAKQWANKAWLLPKVTNGYLLLTICGRNDEPLSSEVYAIYHGRFIEMVVSHCDRLFARAEASALATDGDSLGQQK